MNKTKFLGVSVKTTLAVTVLGVGIDILQPNSIPQEHNSNMILSTTSFTGPTGPSSVGVGSVFGIAGQPQFTEIKPTTQLNERGNSHYNLYNE